MSETAEPAFLLSGLALRCVPALIVDGVAAIYLLRVWRRASSARRTELAALSLGLYFLSLCALALAQLLMCSALDLRTSFLCNHIGQSISAALGVPPLVAFSTRYLAPTRTTTDRLIVAVTVVTAVLICVAFIIDALTTTEMRYDFVSSHGRKLASDEKPWQLLITGFAFVGYSASLAVLCRRAWRAPVGNRWRILRFAAVVFAAVGAIVVNRLETLEFLPSGFYATYVVWTTLGAILLFMGSTDEITSFRERTVSLVLVASLAVLATISQRAVETVYDSERATRRALAPAVLGGLAVEGAVVVTDPVLRAEPTGTVIGSDVFQALILEHVASGAVGFSWLAERRVLHAAALPLSVLTVLCVLGILIVIPRLAQWAVLGPLATLTRAEEQSRAKSMFIAQMSHELKTPLHAILFHTSALLDERAPPGSDERQTRTQTIERAAEHLRSLIDSLLATGRGALQVVTPRPRRVRVSSLLATIAEAHRPVADARDLTIDVSVEPDVPAMVSLDDQLLRQVIDNLIGNGLKYSDHGGVAVTVGVENGGRPDNEQLRVVVVDTGRGIPLAVQESVFQPFFQHDPRQGVGLGLAIVRELVDALGGTVQLASSPGIGTEVVVRVPFVVVEAPMAASSMTTAPLLRPASSDLHTLQALARIGDAIAVGDTARALLAMTSVEHRAFFERVIELASQFQMRRLRRLLNDEDDRAETSGGIAVAPGAAPAGVPTQRGE